MTVYRATTKELLAQSLEDLLGHYSLKSISVKQITQNCGLTRQTFYNHFLDKYDLVCWIFSNDMISKMDKVDFNTYTWVDATKDTNCIIKEKYSYYREAIEDKGQNSLLSFALPEMNDEFIKVIRRNGNSFIPDERFYFALKFFISGSISSISSWILNNCDTDPNILADYLVSSMPSMVRKQLIPV